MRLICPNCDAEYQVDDAAIPEAGRDVQCSNCGHAWFQVHANAELSREAEEDVFGSAPDAAEIRIPAAPPVTAVTPDAAPAIISAPKINAPEISVPEISVPEIIAPEVAAPAAISRQTLAESVLSVLREEADRETAVRRDEGPALRPVDVTSPFETQTEFGLDDTTPPSGASAAARHIARLKGAEPEPPAPPEPKSAARRDLLPDIEEINSTLRATSDRAQAQMDDVEALPNLRPRRRGFRSGFVLVMIIAVVLALTYIMAPRIIAQMPGAAPPMRAYVSSVDSGRLWLDGLMKSASGSLRSFSGDGN